MEQSLPGTKKIRLPFSWKLGIVVTLLSVLITGICVYSLFYAISSTVIARQTGKNLLHVGGLGR